MQERKQLFRLNEGMVALFPKDAVKGFPIDFATLWATASDAQWAGSDLNTQLSAAINDAAFLIDRGALMYVVSKTMSAEKVTDAVVQWAVPATDHIEVNVLTVVANNATLVTKRIANSEAVAAEGVLTGYVKEESYTALVPEDTFNKAFGKLEAGLNFVQNVLFKNYTSVALKSNTGLFEFGVNTKPVLTIDVKFDGAVINPDTLSLKKNNSEVSTDKSAKSYTDEEGITDTATYKLDITYQGVSKSTSVVVKAVRAMYMGGSQKASDLTQDEIKALNKQALKASAAGNYSFEVVQNDYAWFCVPKDFSINKMTSSGFDVPLEAPVTIQVDGYDYKCYRTSSALAAGSMSVTIA